MKAPVRVIPSVALALLVAGASAFSQSINQITVVSPTNAAQRQRSLFRRTSCPAKWDAATTIRAIAAGYQGEVIRRGSA
jgi:hypothetical protein